MWVFLNDRFVQEEAARVSVFDHGFLYGDGVYETLRVYGGRVLLFDQHYARLQHSCEYIGLKNPLPDHRYLEIIAESLKRNELSDAVIRVTLSRGVGEWGGHPDSCLHPTIVVLARVFVPPPRRWQEKGMRLQFVSVRRNSSSTQSPKIKALSFLNNILAKQEATAAGGDDAVMLNMDGFLAECTTSNIFFVANHRIYTPSVACGILEGVTRNVVMTLAQDLEYPLEQGEYLPENLYEAEECFVTNTGIEIMPVTKIGERSVGNGEVGSVCRRLQQAFQQTLPSLVGSSLLHG